MAKTLTKFDFDKIALISKSYPQWMKTWCEKGDDFIAKQCEEVVEDIKRILLEKWSGGWGGIRYGTLPAAYQEWVETNYNERI